MKCPTCDSPSPELHPAVQHEGEVEVCRDLFHAHARVPIGYLRRADGTLIKASVPPQER